MVVSSDTKLVSGEFLSAMRLNINENFVRVSFRRINKSGLHFRFVMKHVGKLEEELVDDIVAEFEALYMPNELNRVDIVREDSPDAEDLENLVFAAYPG